MNDLSRVPEIIAALKVAADIGPQPEFLTILIAQQEVSVRAAARRNDPEPGPNMVSFETLNKQLNLMREMLSTQFDKWAAIRRSARQARFERMLARNDPAERAKAVADINAGFGDRAPRPWQDDMSGVCDPNSIGAEELDK